MGIEGLRKQVLAILIRFFKSLGVPWMKNAVCYVYKVNFYIFKIHCN